MSKKGELTKKKSSSLSCLGCCSANTKVPKPERATPKPPEPKKTEENNFEEVAVNS